MERSNYPVTYRVMSAISADNQRTYFRLLKLQVALLLSIATVSAIDWQLFPFLRTVSIVAASFLIVLSFLQMFAQIQKYDKKWFESRAVAESVKVQTWRFMMQVAPYHDSSDSISPKERFVADVRQLLEEQKDWYSKKAATNSKMHSRWFLATFVLQGGSGIIALLVVLISGFPFNPAGVVATLATSGISWMNAKRYRELSQSYGLIAHDLAGYEAIAGEADSQDKFEKLVSNVESRISGEHTYWKARRLY